MRAAAPLVQEKIAKLGEFPDFAGFLFHDVEPDPALLDRRCSRARSRDARGRGAVRVRADRSCAEGAVRAPRPQAAPGVSRRSVLPSPARRCHPGSTRASSSSAGTSRWPESDAPLRRRGLERSERIEGVLERRPRPSPIARTRPRQVVRRLIRSRPLDPRLLQGLRSPVRVAPVSHFQEVNEGWSRSGTARASKPRLRSAEMGGDEGNAEDRSRRRRRALASPALPNQPRARRSPRGRGRHARRGSSADRAGDA